MSEEAGTSVPPVSSPVGRAILEKFVIKDLDTGSTLTVADVEEFLQRCHLNTFHNTAFRGQDCVVAISSTGARYDASGREYTLYVIHVTLHSQNLKWTIHRRYSDFHDLDRQLHKSPFADKMTMQLPPKVWFGTLEPEVVNERRAALERYLNAVLAAVDFERCLTLKDFLAVPAATAVIESRRPQSWCLSGVSPATASAATPVRTPDSSARSLRVPGSPCSAPGADGMLSLAEAAELYPELRVAAAARSVHGTPPVARSAPITRSLPPPRHGGGA